MPVRQQNIQAPSRRSPERERRHAHRAMVTAWLLMFVLCGEVARATDFVDGDYSFPYRNPLVATILSVINRAVLPYKKIRLDLHPERVNLPGLVADPSVEMGLFEQKGRSAPLVFVIAGTGGNGLSGSALLLASQLAKLGYHAITLPNPLSSEYVLGVSQSTLPGYLPLDSKEYYGFLMQIVGHLQNQRHMKIKGFSLVGFSYGATLAGFLNQVDHQRHIFQFQKTVMLNPAMDVAYGSAVLDGYNARGRYYYPQDRFNIFQKIRELITAVRGRLPSTGGEDAKYTEAQVERLAIDDIQMQWMIGDSFRTYLQKLVFASQQIHDRGILRATDLKSRLVEAKTIGFTEYISSFVALSLGVKNEPAAIRQFMRNTGYYGLVAELSRDRGAYVMANADDFLLQNGDVETLRRSFGSRLYLYPYGGHIGNFRFVQNQKDFAAIMGAAPREP